MAAKIALVFLSAVLFVQMITWGVDGHVTRVAREAPADKNLSQQVDEALQSFKSNLDDLLKNIQENELFQNISTQVTNFGASVKQESEQLVQKLQKQTAPK